MFVPNVLVVVARCVKVWFVAVVVIVPQVAPHPILPETIMSEVPEAVLSVPAVTVRLPSAKSWVPVADQVPPEPFMVTWLRVELPERITPPVVVRVKFSVPLL